MPPLLLSDHAYRAQRVLLCVGAVYDLAFAVLMVTMPEATASLFGVPLPEPRAYLGLIAVFLSMLGVLYLAAAYDLRRLAVVPSIAGWGRLAGAAVFVAWARADPAHGGLWVLAAVDGALGLAHLAAQRATRVLVAR
jgi:hypothetical protein